MMLSESLCTHSLPYEIVHGAGGWKEGAGSRAGSWREALGSLPEPTGCPGRAGPHPASPQGSSLRLQYLLLPSSWSVGVKNELVLAGWLPKIASPAVRGHFNVKPGVTSAELLKFTVPFFPPSVPSPRRVPCCLVCLLIILQLAGFVRTSGQGSSWFGGVCCSWEREE